MTDLDPERFTLRQAAQARDDFAQIMDELDFVKELLARLPTRRDQAFTTLRIMFGSAASAPRSYSFGWKCSGGITSDGWPSAAWVPSWSCYGQAVHPICVSTRWLVSLDQHHLPHEYPNRNPKHERHSQPAECRRQPCHANGEVRDP